MPIETPRNTELATPPTNRPKRAAGKVAAAILVVLVAAAIVVALVGPRMVDDRFNKVAPTAYVPSATAIALHDSLFVVDLHADQMLWDRDVRKRVRRGHVDLPRMQAGNVGLQVFSAVTKSPRGQNYERNAGDTDRITALVVAQLRPVATWYDVNARALHQAAQLRRAIAASQGAMRLVESRADLARLTRDRALGNDVTGALLAMEGLHDLRGDPERFRQLVEAGYRMMAFTHFFDNALGGSAHGLEKGGLTDFGRTVVELMRDAHVVMDLAHVSEASMDEILDVVDRPVVVSHSGVQGTCPGPRNLSDRMIRRIAENGGVIGIGYWAGAVCGVQPADIANAARYVADLVGSEHVAIGSDFDGSVTTGFDASGHVLVTSALLDAGFASEEIRGIMGGNALRVLYDNLE